MRVIAVISFTMALVSFSTYAQPRDMARDDPGAISSFLFFEAVNRIASDSAHSLLDVHYRIDQNFFIAVKNRETSSPWPFASRGEVLVEIFDSLGVSRSRSIQRVHIGTDHADREPTRKSWYQGIASFELSPGLHKIVIEIDDLESERRYVDDKMIIRLKRFGSSSRETSTPLFMEWTNGTNSPQRITPIGFGPHLLFGRKAALYIELPAGRKIVGSARAEYSFSTTSSVNRSRIVVLAETLAHIITLPKVRLESSSDDHGINYALTSNDSSQALGVVIPLSSEKLPLRQFDVSVTIQLDGVEFNTTKSLQMVWPDMPFSLRDVDNAISSLKYISTEEQRDSIRHGNFEERRDNLELFWKNKDSTPETMYNEVMIEYYRRVDHATRSFGTLREPDGFKSDRGRIYVLYGPPTNTERTLSPSSGYQEEWTYAGIGKRFIFADQSKSGNYILVSSQSL